MSIILRSTLVSLITFALLSTSTGVVSSQQPQPNAQVAIVTQLYRDFAWEAVLFQPDLPGLFDQPRDVLEKYFDQKLTALILQDRACAAKQGMCNLDFLPLWDSQNPGATDLEVSQTAQSTVVSVKYRDLRSSKTIALSYQLTNTDQGWRISNISTSDWSLISILSAKP
jgi:hypothetical protein